MGLVQKIAMQVLKAAAIWKSKGSEYTQEYKNDSLFKELILKITNRLPASPILKSGSSNFCI